MGQDASTLGGCDVERLRMMLNLVQLEQSMRQRPPGETSQADHAWDPDDCSPNFTLKENDRVAERSGRTTSTDMVRAKKGYTKGTHIWEITWKKEHRGSHAVVGVASNDAPLQCAGYSALLGSNDESLGWDIVNNVSLFNDCVINKYPRDDVQPDFQAPDVILVILNMDEGTLRFKSGIDRTDYGLCLSGLRAFSRNGQKLYPAISVTKHGAQIGIKYLGSSEPMYDAVGGTADTASGTVVFHSEVGANIELSNGRRTATRVRGHNKGVIMSTRPLKDDEYFEVKLDKTKLLPTKYVMDIGVTTNSPEKLNFPETMTDCQHGRTWMFCDSQIVLNQKVLGHVPNFSLNELEDGSTVGLMRTASGQLHIFLNGLLKGKFAMKVPPDVYAVVDLFGKGCQVTITGCPPSAPTSPSATSPPSRGAGATALLATTATRSTVEIITDNVHATIALMKQKDSAAIPGVFAAIQKYLLNVYNDMRTPAHKQMLGDRFCDLDGAKAIANYMVFLKDIGIENEEVKYCVFACFNVLLNFTHASHNFARALGETEAFPMLLRQADKLRTRYTSSKTKARLVVYSLAVLHNCSKTAGNVNALRRAGAREVFAQYCDPSEHEPSIAFVALLSLVNILVGPEVKSLKVHDNMLATLVKYTADAVGNDDNHSAPVIFATAELGFSFYSTEQVAAICNLSKNTACRVSLVKKKVTQHLVRLMEIGDQTEQELACNAVWELLSEQTVLEVIMCPKLTDVVTKTKDADVKEVADAAKRLLVKIEQVLQRSRAAGTTQQVMPSTAAQSRDCKYKQACMRYLKQLNIRDENWDKEWHACYCSDCNAASEKDNYDTRGDPPRQYGVPLGWHRFGINVLPQKKRHFEEWHRAFHGTKADRVVTILDIGDLMLPGDKIRGGDKIKERPGHFDTHRKPENFDTRQIFVSPSIRYAGHHAYATPSRYVDEVTNTTYRSQVAFQLLIAPQSYTVGPETVGATHDIDPKFSNQELEWSTDRRGCIVLYGLLVKLDEVRK